MLRYRPGVALIIVDVQNDFADPRGSLAVRGAVDVIPVINAEAALARSTGAGRPDPGLAPAADPALHP